MLHGSYDINESLLMRIRAYSELYVTSLKLYSTSSNQRYGGLVFS